MSVIQNYNGYYLDVFINKGDTFIRATGEYIENNFGVSAQNWIGWVRLFDYDKDGDVDIVGDGLYGDLLDKVIYWNNNGGKFVKAQQ